MSKQPVDPAVLEAIIRQLYDEVKAAEEAKNAIVGDTSNSENSSSS